MIKKRITWKDFLEESHTEDFYFHLKEDELVEIELGNPGETFSSYLQTMVKSEDKSAILKAFKTVISASYGKRSEDGRKFRKDSEWTKEFMASEAYTALFMELVTSETAAVEFILGVVPADLIEQAGGADKILSGEAITTINLPETPFTVTGDKDIRPLSDEELGKRMQLPAAFRRPPIAKVSPGTIVLPADLQNLTRDELLAAYDRQMTKKPDDPAPPAA
jgi:hypothetical protein